MSGSLGERPAGVGRERADSSSTGADSPHPPCDLATRGNPCASRCWPSILRPDLAARAARRARIDAVVSILDRRGDVTAPAPAPSVAAPALISMAGQVTLVGLVIVLPLLWVAATQLPEMPTMMAFVAAPPVPPPPPPPPAPVVAARKAPTPPATPPAPGQLVAPIEAPPAIEAEAAGTRTRAFPAAWKAAFPAVSSAAWSAACRSRYRRLRRHRPNRRVRRAPFDWAGKLQTPALVRRVEPNYPPFLAQARVQGVVILEAVINEEGAVTDVKVLRSVNPLLDREAVLAVRQWRYSPLLLNGDSCPVHPHGHALVLPSGAVAS